MKKKSDFVVALLAEKNLSCYDREKILELSAYELALDKNKIENDLISITKTLSAFKEENKKDINKIQVELKSIKQNIEKKYNPIQIEPNPKHMAEFMSLFNKREGLKYLTHDFDENSEFKIIEFLTNAYMVFNESTKPLNIPQSLWRIVKEFAFEKTQPEWTSISDDYSKTVKLKIGWASEELRTWAKKNKLHPIRNKKYENVLNSFKRITRIKEPDLENLVSKSLEESFKDKLKNYKITKSQLYKADFYTHVSNLKVALVDIFKIIEEREKKKNYENTQLEIQYIRSYSDDGFALRQLIVTHYNSYPSKELQVLCEEYIKQEKGTMGKVKNLLRGYCHWSIETLVENKPTRINILKDDKEVEFELFEGPVQGFSHILTFYYK